MVGDPKERRSDAGFRVIWGSFKGSFLPVSVPSRGPGVCRHQEPLREVQNQARLEEVGS